MKYIKSYILFALMVMAVSGCKTDDLKDDVSDLENRVALLEEQVKILNDNVEAMAYILNPGNLTIKDVVESADETTFTITLSNGKTLTLRIGKPGTVASPTIGIDDNYWVINGVKTQYKAIGENGANGDGVPQFKVEDGKWKVSFDGKEWKTVDGGGSIGEVTLGEKLFKSAEIVEEGDSKYFVITTLKGDVIKLSVTGLTCKINVETETSSQPISFSAGDIKDFDVEISGGEPLAPVYPAGWRAELTKKTETDNEYNYTLTVYAPATRAVADNSSDISVRVTDGTSWAVDKITVTLQ